MTDGYNQNKELKPLKTLGLLEKLLVAEMITEEEYKERKTVYVESLLELYSFLNDRLPFARGMKAKSPSCNEWIKCPSVTYSLLSEKYATSTAS